MAPQHEAAVEPKDEVLSDRLDALESPAVEPLGDAGRRRPWMGRLDLERLTDQRLQPAGRAVECVTLGHGGLSATPESLGGRPGGRNARR